MNLKTAHLVTGAVGILLFALQGQYMAIVLQVPELADGPRLMYRTSHLYLMLVSAINLFVGYYMASEARAGLLQRIISTTLMLAPVALLVSFVIESDIASFERPIAAFTLYLVFGAASLLLTVEVLRRWQGR